MNQTWLPSHTGPTVIDRHAAFGVGLGDKGQERAHPHVEPVGQREADQQDAQKAPPDHPQNIVGNQIVKRHGHHSAAVAWGAPGTLPSWVRRRVFVARRPGVGLGDVHEGALADVFQHQAHLDHEEDRIERS